jgi:hypothetical protein
MNVTIEVRTPDGMELVTSLMGKNACRGDELNLEEGMSLRYRGIHSERNAGDIPDLVVFALSLPAGIAVNLITDTVNRYFQRRRSRTAGISILVEEEVTSTDEHGTRITRRMVNRIEIPPPGSD